MSKHTVRKSGVFTKGRFMEFSKKTASSKGENKISSEEKEFRTKQKENVCLMATNHGNHKKNSVSLVGSRREFLYKLRGLASRLHKMGNPNPKKHTNDTKTNSRVSTRKLHKNCLWCYNDH